MYKKIINLTKYLPYYFRVVSIWDFFSSYVLWKCKTYYHYHRSCNTCHTIVECLIYHKYKRGKSFSLLRVDFPFFRLQHGVAGFFLLFFSLRWHLGPHCSLSCNIYLFMMTHFTILCLKYVMQQKMNHM